MPDPSIEINPVDVIRYTKGISFSTSQNGQFGILPYEYGTVMFIDSTHQEFSTTLELEEKHITWCTISDCGQNLAYGNFPRYPQWCYFANLTTKRTSKLPEAINGIISDQFLWLLIDFDGHLKIERRQLGDLSVLSSVYTPEWKNYDYYVSQSLVETYRPNTIGVQVPGLGSFIVEQSSEAKYTARQIHSTPGEFASYYAPHGGELLILTGKEIQRIPYPFDAAQATASIEGLQNAGCYIDDSHFLTADRDGTLYLLHTRSCQLVARLKLKNNTRRHLISAKKIGDRIYLNFTSVSRPTNTQIIVVSVESLLEALG